MCYIINKIFQILYFFPFSQTSLNKTYIKKIMTINIPLHLLWMLQFLLDDLKVNSEITTTDWILQLALQHLDILHLFA